MTPHTRADDVADALAWTQAFIAGDGQARKVIAEHCDPVGMTDGLAFLYAGLIDAAVTDHDVYFARIRELIAQMADDPTGRSA